MFGIKIISETEFNHMKCEVEEKQKFEREFNKQVRDNQSLRDQLNAEMKKVKAYEGREEKTNTIVSELCNYHIIRENNYPCDKCNIESKGCKKLMFADRNICVCPKDEIVSFRSNKNKGAKKPDPKI